MTSDITGQAAYKKLSVTARILMFFSIAAFLLAILVILVSRPLIRSQFNVLDSASRDNIVWTLTQAEHDAASYQHMIDRYLLGEEERFPKISEAFDIFYGRVSMIEKADQFIGLRKDPEFSRHLKTISDYLSRNVYYFDENGQALINALPQISEEYKELASATRQLGLAGLKIVIARDVSIREDFYEALTTLLVSAVLLLAAVLALFCVLYWQNRLLKISARDKTAQTARLKAMINASVDAVIVADRQGVVLDINKSAVGVFRYSFAEAIGRTIDELIVPDDLRERHRAGMRAFAETGVPKLVGGGLIQIEARDAFGRIFPVELSIESAEANGETVIVGYIRDISDRIEKEQQLQEASEKALESSAAKNRFLSAMNHEMRTPITGLIAALDNINIIEADTAVKDHVHSAKRSAHLLLNHINTVLDFANSTIDSRDFQEEVFNLSEFMDDFVEFNQEIVKSRDNKLILNFESKRELTLKGNSRVLHQILLNLLGIANKHISSGLISVDVPAPKIEDECVKLEIQVGYLKKADGQYIADQTAWQKDGDKFALEIGERLANSLDGHVRVFSDTDVESRVGFVGCFALSNTLDSPQPIKKEVQPLRILFAEDNEINGELIASILEHLGNTVDLVKNGAEAIEKYIEHKSLYDLVLMDVSMPVMDGTEAAGIIRNMHPPANSIPIIALTAHAQPEDRQEFIESGFDDVMIKPFDLDIWKETISRIDFPEK